MAILDIARFSRLPTAPTRPPWRTLGPEDINADILAIFQYLEEQSAALDDFYAEIISALMSSTTPAVASGLVISSQGIEQASDGATVAFVVLDYTIPSETFAETVVKARRTGTTLWELIDTNIDTATAQQTRISDLTPGLSYDYRVERTNTADPSLLTGVELLSQIAPGDTTAPASASAIVVRQGTAKSVEIALTFTEPVDWGAVELYRNTSDNSATAALIDRKKAKIFHDVNVAYGTTYYYWAKIMDLTGNKSAFSPSSGHSITPTQVATADVTDAAITTPKRQLLNLMFLDWGTLGIGQTKILTFVHNLGVIPMIVPIVSMGAGDFSEFTVFIDVNGSSSSTVVVALAPDAVGSLLGGITIEFF